MKAGISIALYVSREELINAKDGGSTLVASKAKTKEADYQIIVDLGGCDILENEVRVNLASLKAKAEASANELGLIMGQSMAAELEKVMSE